MADHPTTHRVRPGARVPVLAQDVDSWKRSDRPRYLHHMAGGRELDREVVAGVPHFKPGQHHATLSPWGTDYFTGDPIQVGRLTFVDAMGYLCVLLVSRPAETAPWQVNWASRHGQMISEAARRVAPGGIALSPKMLRALEAARVTDHD